MLDMLDAHLKAAPDSRYVRQERVPMTTLSAVIRRHAAPDDRIMVKLDAQGYEMPLLDGAGEDLERVTLLQVEMSLVNFS